MLAVSRSLAALGLLVVACTAFPASSTAAPEGQMVLAQTVSIAPRWFDPAEAEGIISSANRRASSIGGSEAILHRVQQLMHEQAMFGPLMEIASLSGYGPRVAESGMGLITHMAAPRAVRGSETQGPLSVRQSRRNSWPSSS